MEVNGDRFAVLRGHHLSVRLYGSDIAVVARRDGKRVALRSRLSPVLWQLAQAAGPDALRLLAHAPDDGAFDGEVPEPLGMLMRDLFARLDARGPTPKVDLLRQVPALLDFALQQRLPLGSMVELTYRCNLRCQHCYVLHKVTEASPARMDTSKAMQVIDSAAALGALDITVSGGETTLHPDYRTVLKYAKDRFLYTTLKTNAITFSPAAADHYGEDPAHETHVSLYGATPEIHDRMTAVRGSFDKTVTGLRQLARVGVTCKVNVLVWKDNAGEVGAIKDLVEDLGHHANFDGIVYGRLNGDQSPLAFRITPEVRSRLVADGYLKDFTGPAPCTAGKMKVKVDAEGGVVTCEMLPIPVGNVHQAPLEEIWRSQHAAAFSDKVLSISTSERENGKVVLSCPGLNLISTGVMTGRTTI